MQERIQCLVKHVQLRGWRGTQGSQKSWVSRVPESPSSVFEAKAVCGARKRQLWGWRRRPPGWTLPQEGEPRILALVSPFGGAKKCHFRMF